MPSKPVEPLRSGNLYVVATPIGNLEDITFRAVRILKEAHLIVAEDTRHTAKLLSHYQITTEVISCHEHNEELRINTILEKLSQGLDAALVSDAGTPLISDPGYRVVKGVIDAGFKAVPIPGPCAAIAGLTVSALPTDSFIFAGFLNRKKGKRILELQNLSQILKHKPATIIFYESPYRVITLIEDILEIMGDREAVLAREITKLYEEYLRGNLSDILTELNSRASIKGECSLFLGSCSKITGDLFEQTNINSESTYCDNLQSIYDELDKSIAVELESSQIKASSLAKALAQKYNIPRRDVYSRIIKLH